MVVHKMGEVDWHIREATDWDVPMLQQLIAESVRGLARIDYTPEQIEAAIGTAWGVDSQLVCDRTYFVAEAKGAIVACGGWSYRKTCFGGDGHTARDTTPLDPARDAARIRAFFVRPTWTRKGIGRALLARCEDEARNAGFQRVELVATLPGHRLYRNCGFEGDQPVRYELPGGVGIDFIPMGKTLAPGVEEPT